MREIVGTGLVRHVQAPRGVEKAIELDLVAALRADPQTVWVDQQMLVGVGGRRLDVLSLVHTDDGPRYVLYEVKGGSGCRCAFDQAFLYAVSLRCAGLVDPEIPIIQVVLAPALCPSVPETYLEHVSFMFAS